MGKRTLVLSLMAVTACLVISTASCQGESRGWSDIPPYPESQQLSLRTWPVSSGEGVPWSVVEWRYYSSDDRWPDVLTFYDNELPTRGWMNKTSAETPMMSEVIASYYAKISLYEDVSVLEGWSYFSKNDSELVIVWVGLRVTKPQPGKTYITFNDESHNTFIAVMRTSQE